MNQRTRQANIMAVALFLPSLPYPLLFWIFGFNALAASTGICLFLYTSPLWLNSRGYYSLAKALPLLAACASIGSICFVFGPDIQLQQAFFLLACWPFQLFDARRERRLLFGMVALALIPFLLVQLALPSSKEELSVGLRWVQAGMSVSVVSIFALTLGFFYARNQANEQRLEVSLAELALEVKERAAAQGSLESARGALQVALRAKTNFLSMMSHELRTPLNGVLGGVDLLEPTSLDQEQQSFLTAIRASGEHLLKLLESVWNYVSLDTTDATLKREPLDLSTLIERALQQNAARAHRKGVELDFELDPTCEYSALGDSEKLEQLLRQVVANAIHFTKTGWVHVNIRTEPAGNQTVLWVDTTDTGCGIPVDLQPHVFKPFEQAADSRRRGLEGLGLGLALCRQLSTLMGGTITTQDRPGGGTTVLWSVLLAKAKPETVKLKSKVSLPERLRINIQEPRLRKAVASVVTAIGVSSQYESGDPGICISDNNCEVGTLKLHGQGGTSTILSRPLSRSGLAEALDGLQIDATLKREAKLPAGSSKRSVLIAEDNKINQLVLKSILKKLNCKVTVAENGQLALEAWKARPFDVIFMDIQMPEMDGLEAIEEIRKEESLTGRRFTPIVIVTANASSEQRQQGAQLGIQGYLTKPCARSDIEHSLLALDEGSGAVPLS